MCADGFLLPCLKFSSKIWLVLQYAKGPVALVRGFEAAKILSLKSPIVKTLSKCVFWRTSEEYTLEKNLAMTEEECVFILYRY
jgi:hypothetical protein